MGQPGHVRTRRREGPAGRPSQRASRESPWQPRSLLRVVARDVSLSFGPASAVPSLREAPRLEGEAVGAGRGFSKGLCWRGDRVRRCAGEVGYGADSPRGFSTSRTASAPRHTRAERQRRAGGVQQGAETDGEADSRG